jgi:hypothetical protein
MVRARTFLWLLPLAALLLLLPAPAGRAADGAPEVKVASGADVIFLVDASGSVQSTDPHSARRTVIRAIIDLALRRGGDRVAVYRFAGRRETAERAEEAATLPLTEVPRDARRAEVLAELHDAAGRAAEIFPGAMATDFNAAFEVGLARILELRRASGRPLWVVLLSDGDSEVERGSAAHPPYVEEAKQRYGKTLTRYLNKAATDLLREKVLPSVDGPGRFFTAINVAAPEVSDGDALAAVASRGRGGEVLRVTDRPLRDLILPAFRTAPGELGRPVARGIAYETFSVDGSAERGFKTCGRLGRTGMLVFADSPDYQVELAKPDGEPLTEGSIEISGQGERYRVVTVAGLPCGEYRFRVVSEKPIQAERIVYHEMDVAAEATLVQKKKVFRPGETVDVDLRLVDRRTGRPVVDADVLEDVTAAVRVQTPAGAVDVGEVALADSGVGRLTWTIPPGAERGDWIVDVRATGLLDPGGEPGLRAETRSAARFLVGPAIAVSWEVGEIDVGGAASLRGRPPAGTLPVDVPVPVRLTHEEGASRNAMLEWSAESGAWVGTVKGLDEGAWRVSTPPDARIEVLVGKVGSLNVVSPTSAKSIPWLWILLGALAVLMALVLFGIFRTMRRRAMVVEEAAVEAEPLEAERDAATALGALGGDEADEEGDDEELLLDDEDVEEFLAALDDPVDAEEETKRRHDGEPEPEVEDFETLILEE